MAICENKGLKILQIIAAVLGWKAVHCQESENGQVEIFNRTVICWALVEFRGEDNAVRTEVRGVEQAAHQLVIVGDLIQTDTERDVNQYFLGYSDPETHKESDHWIMQANARLMMANGKRTTGETRLASPVNDALLPSGRM